jgi:lipoprotein signal peptidase
MPKDNPRFALGVAAAHPTVMVAMMTVGIVVALAVGGRLVRQQHIPPTVAGLAIGGALANTADRMLNGSVQDFLVLGPVILNLADLAVVAGVLGAIYTHKAQPDQGPQAPVSPAKELLDRAPTVHVAPIAPIKSRY